MFWIHSYWVLPSEEVDRNYTLSKLLILQMYTLWSFDTPWFKTLSSLRRYPNYSGNTTIMNKRIPELLNTHQIECTLNKLVWLYHVFGYCRTVWEGVSHYSPKLTIKLDPECSSIMQRKALSWNCPNGIKRTAPKNI